MSHKNKKCEDTNYELGILLAQLQQTIERWFSTTNAEHITIANENINYKQFVEACVNILKHGLIIKEARDESDIWFKSEDDITSSCSEYAFPVQKFKDDFDWLLTITQLRHRNVKRSNCATIKQQTNATNSNSIQQYLFDWICKTFEEKSLCACLQALTTDKELIGCYYNSDAFVRSDAYANALFICTKAMELQQYNILNQMNTNLYEMAGVASTGKCKKGTGSHPNLSMLESIEQKQLITKDESLSTHKRSLKIALRKSQSLPAIPGFAATSLARPRSKTIGTRLLRSYVKKNTESRTIPTPQHNLSAISCSADYSSCSQDELDMQPSTSAHSRNQSVSNYSNTPTRHIQIINCDNIKIWTDQSFEQSTHHTPRSSCSTTSSDMLVPPSATQFKPCKSVSPINSFFANLFGTPPTYTSWSPQKAFVETANVEALDTSLTASAFPCNPQKSSPLSTSVFDAFLPAYGKKLRTRKSQNLFDENGISTLDYSNTASNTTVPIVDEHAKEENNEQATNNGNQNLSDYLKLSHRSRNNTDLEKENAHFTISEAIITAIEHMKWAKTGPDKRRRLDVKDAKTATDWLEKEHNSSSNACTKDGQAQSAEINELAEHIPYAELGCFDELSAEIIGLTLISKFNDKQLPKVSELKWLVADEDTPQKLLPMPDDSPTANPDEHVAPKQTRGTRYWAPPRQQIIFTDHPVPHRRNLIQKQNYRCAGCGMRISPQNMQSFRYCTYFGKYHCTGCHRNQMSPTPAKILTSWDFKCYPVSVFAYRLLDQMFTHPLFYVPDLNAALYTKCKALLIARQKRRQLNFIKDFIRLCRFAVREQQYFQQIPNYITDDPDLWSMSDFIDVKEKSMKRSIEDLVVKCENHIHNCGLCRAHGFYCEHCRKDQIIFPWENKIFRCDRCGSCYHLNCWRAIAEICYKCQRLIKRQANDTL